jgi:hypothetical protein
MHSLIGTCKLVGIEPEAYLRRVIITHIADHPINRVDELSPWRVAALLLPASTKCRHATHIAVNHGRDAPLTAIAFEVTIKHASIIKVLVAAVRYRTDTIGAGHEPQFFSRGYSPAAEPLTMDEQCH